MANYKFFSVNGAVRSIQRDNSFIPLDMMNRDCRQFVEDWQAGASVVDQEDNPVTYSEEALAALNIVPLPDA
jgi:hypothetical protein